MRRNQGLDILRGIAILLVLGYHYQYFRLWGQIGWAGVDLFFVLSGFLISGLLFSEYQKRGEIRLKRFWVRRGFKIYPAFYCLMAFEIAVLALKPAFPWRDVADELLFVQSYLPHCFIHSWSLAVEEHFYFALPIALLAMMRFSRDRENPFRAIVPVFGILCVGCLALRWWAFARGVDPSILTLRTHLRIDSLFCGVTLGYLRYYHADLLARLTRMRLWIPGILLALPAFILPRWGEFMCTAALTMVFLASGCFLVCAVGRPESRGLGARALAAVGRYSYSIYLWHAILVSWIFHPIHPTLAIFALYLASAIFLGVVMSAIIELPALALRDRIIPREKRPAQAAVPSAAEVTA